MLNIEQHINKDYAEIEYLDAATDNEVKHLVTFELKGAIERKDIPGSVLDEGKTAILNWLLSEIDIRTTTNLPEYDKCNDYQKFEHLGITPGKAFALNELDGYYFVDTKEKAGYDIGYGGNKRTTVKVNGLYKHILDGTWTVDQNTTKDIQKLMAKGNRDYEIQND